MLFRIQLLLAGRLHFVFILACLLCPFLSGSTTRYISLPPRLNEVGSVVFRAEYAVTGVTDRQASLVLNLASGSSVSFPLVNRSYSAGTRFGFNDHNDLLFLNGWGGSDSLWDAVYLYDHAAGKLEAILTPDDLDENFGLLHRSSQFVLNNNGKAAFTVVVVPEWKDRLYLYDVSTRELTLVAQQGDPAAGGTETYGSFRDLRLNDLGTLTFGADLNVCPEPIPACSVFGSSFRKRASLPVERLDLAGQPLPGGGTLGIARVYGLNDKDTLVIAGSTEGQPGLFAMPTEGGVEALAVHGQQVDGITLDMRYQEIVKPPFPPKLSFLTPEAFLNDRDEVLIPVPGPSSSGPILLTPARSPNLSIIGSFGAPVQIDSRTFALGTPVGFNNLSQAVFGTSDSQAVLLREASGTFRLILASSDPVPGRPDLSFATMTPVQLNSSQQVLVEAVLSNANHAWLVGDAVTGKVREIAVSGESTDPEILVFPQFADGHYGGGFIKTSLFLINRTTFPNSATLAFRRSDGSPAVVQIEGQLKDEFLVTVPPKGTVLLETEPGPSLQNGYVVVTSAGELSGSQVFSTFGPAGTRGLEAAVLSSSASRLFTIGIEARNDVNTGVALVNMTSETAHMTFTLRNQAGEILGIAERELQSGQHLALHLAGELFPDVQDAIGSLEIESSVEVHKVALRTTPVSLTTLP